MAALTVLQGRAAGEAILRARAAADRPDAIFAANDLLAVGVLQAFALMADVRVPDDIALIGYDDIDFAAATVVPLSSIRQPAHLIGYTAVDLLLKDLADPDGRARAHRALPAGAGRAGVDRRLSRRACGRRVRARPRGAARVAASVLPRVVTRERRVVPARSGVACCGHGRPRVCGVS